MSSPSHLRKSSHKMPAEVRTHAEADLADPAAKRRTLVKSSNPVNADGLSECFQVVRTTLYVSVAPCHSTNPINGIKAQHLDPMIMSYFAKGQGVVLSYSNVSVSKEHHSLDTNDQPITIAKVGDSTPFLFMWITVDFLIWRPQIGDTLEGYIYMQTASHIGLLVHDTFNASIKFRNIPQDWEFVPSQADEFGEAEEQEDAKSSKFRSYGYWADGSGTKVEGKITFAVRAIHSTGRMLSVEGTLVSPESEIDAQPVFEGRRSSTTAASPVASKHMKFDDEPSVAVAEIAEPNDDVIPSYEKSDGEHNDLSSDSDDSSD